MYNNMENVLQAVNSKYISLSNEDIKCNNEILDNVLTTFLTELKKDDLFNTLFERVFYGGSYYDDLRVGKPNEFDLDILFRIPKKKVDAQLLPTNIPGYVLLQAKKPDGLGPKFMKLLDSKGHLSNNKVRQWIEGVINIAMNNLSAGKGVCFIKANNKQYKVRLTKSGPAMTLHLDQISIDIDLVPCFVFFASDWPVGGYTANPTPEKAEFFIVPKLPKQMSFSVDKYWRLSFQEQERALIKSKKFLKPSLKLLKRLRDAQGHHAIASYYIKTIFLWEIVKNDATFWNDNLSKTFLKMFNKYIEYLEKHQIPYFWNKKNNLLSSIGSDTISNYANRLRIIYKDIERNASDPFKICTYLRTPITQKEAEEAAVQASSRTLY